MVSIPSASSAFKQPATPLLPPDVVAQVLTAGIEAALAAMQTEVDSKNAAAVLIKTTEDVARDIRELRSKKGQYSKATELFRKLEGLQTVIAMAHIEADTKTIVKPPLMSEIIELKKRAETYSKGPVKEGLLKLDSLLVMRTIRGDGHCLFRAVLAHTLEKLLLLPNSARETKLTKLRRVVEAFGKTALTEQFAFFKQIIDKAAITHSSFSDIICDEATSDKLVAFLRHLACEHNRQTKNDVVDSFIVASGKNKSEYLADMMSMQKATYGDHLEVQALSTLLDINICVVDVVRYGKSAGSDEAGQAFRHLHAHAGKMELFLLYRSNHYDFGILKNSLSKEPPQARGMRHFIERAKEKGWLVAKA